MVAILCTRAVVAIQGEEVVTVSVPPPLTGIQQKSCDLICVLCELQLIDQMSDEVLMPLASALVSTMLNWKSEVEVLGKVSGWEVEGG